MSERHEIAKLLKKPLLTWVALCVALGVTLGYAFIRGAPLKAEAGLVFAGIKAGLIVLLFMQLNRSATIVRLAAMAGLVWLSLMFLFTFAELMTR